MAKIYGNTTTTPIKPDAFGGNVTVDQTFNPESENAQSGKAVFEAVEPIFNDVIELQSKVGGNVTLTYTEVDKMINSSGIETTAPKYLKFYQVNDLSGVSKIRVNMENATNETRVHWVNQIDTNGNVIDYTPISKLNTEFYINLSENCVSIKISFFISNGKFKLTKETENNIATNAMNIATNAMNIATNAMNIATNKANIAENASKIADILGGEVYFNTIDVPTMLGTDGSVKTATSTIHFLKVDDVEGATKVTFNFPNKSTTTHWFNQIDSNGTVISYAPFYVASGEYTVNLQPNVKSIVFSVWYSNGDATVKCTKTSKVVNIDRIKSGYVKLSALGDSITAGYCKKNDADYMVEDTYQKLIAQRLGINFQNLGMSSTPICPNSDYADGQNNNAFVYRYTKIASDADLILVCGGTNDFRHLVPIGEPTDTSDQYQETFYGAVDYLINNIMAAHPLARLVFVSPFHQQWDTLQKTTLDGSQVYLQDYIDALRTKCKQYGVYFIDAFSESGISLRSDFVTNYMPDSLHPNDDGHKIIYRNLMHHFATL